MSPTGRACVAEAIGTFAAVLHRRGRHHIESENGGAVGLIGIALAHGVDPLGHDLRDGARLGRVISNPAVTIGFMVTKKTDGGTGISYIISQLVGGTVAGILLRIIFAADVWQKVNLGTPTLASDVSFGMGILIEIILTFFLVTAIWAPP